MCIQLALLNVYNSLFEFAQGHLPPEVGQPQCAGTIMLLLLLHLSLPPMRLVHQVLVEVQF